MGNYFCAKKSVNVQVILFFKVFIINYFSCSFLVSLTMYYTIHIYWKTWILRHYLVFFHPLSPPPNQGSPGYWWDPFKSTITIKGLSSFCRNSPQLETSVNMNLNVSLVKINKSRRKKCVKVNNKHVNVKVIKYNISGQFACMKAAGQYYITVIEDTRINRLIGAASLVTEFKFIHECGLRGRLEDVVVNNTYRGKQLGKL